MKSAVTRKLILAVVAFEVIQADRHRVQKVFHRAAGSFQLEHGVVPARAVSRTHVGHEDAQRTVAFGQEGVEGSLQAIADIGGRRIIVQRAGVSMMDNDTFTVGAFGDEVISQSFEAGGEGYVKLIHSGEVGQRPDRAGHVGNDSLREAGFGKSRRSPNILEQRLPCSFGLTGRMNRDGMIVQQWRAPSQPGRQGD